MKCYLKITFSLLCSDLDSLTAQLNRVGKSSIGALTSCLLFSLLHRKNFGWRRFYINPLNEVKSISVNTICKSSCFIIIKANQ